jgi:hypothetical protein
VAAFVEEAHPASEVCLFGIVCRPIPYFDVIGGLVDNLMLGLIALLFDVLGIIMLGVGVKAVWRRIGGGG